MIESILTFGARRRFISGALITVLSIIAIIGASQLKVDTSYDSLVSPEDPGWPA